MTRSLLALLTILLNASAANGADGLAILQIRVAEGEGAAYPLGSRATRGLTVLVTDESGRAVEGATVSFSLPADGPGGVFASGSRSEVTTTRGDGIASVWGMQWNRTAGPFEIRITAARGAARAGTSVAQVLRDTTSEGAGNAGARPPRQHNGGSGMGNHKILWIAAAVVGAALAGAGLVRGGGTAASSTAATTSGVQIGTPTITLGRP